MHLSAGILRALPATLALFALCGTVGAQELAERDFLDGSLAVDSLVQPTQPIPPPTPYESPVGLVYFSTDLVGFSRSNASGVFVRTSTRAVALSGDDVDFANQPGLKTLLGFRLTDYAALEASYVGLFDWNEQHTVRSNAGNTLGLVGNLLSPFSAFGQPVTPGLDFLSRVTVSVETQFNTAELNMRHRIDLPYSTVQSSVVYGTRYLGVRDRFGYQSQSNVPLLGGTAISAQTDTNNQMFGPQLGGALEMHVAPRGWLNLEAKGLMLYNDASQSTQFFSGPLAGPAGAPVTGSRSDHQLTYGADVQATLMWKFHRAIVWRVGYQAIFLERLSLASENFLVNAPVATVDPSQLSKDGNAVFHGPFTGVTVTW